MQNLGGDGQSQMNHLGLDPREIVLPFIDEPFQSMGDLRGLFRRLCFILRPQSLLGLSRGLGACAIQQLANLQRRCAERGLLFFLLYRPLNVLPWFLAVRRGGSTHVPVHV